MQAWRRDGGPGCQPGCQVAGRAGPAEAAAGLGPFQVSGLAMQMFPAPGPPPAPPPPSCCPVLPSSTKLRLINAKFASVCCMRPPVHACAFAFLPADVRPAAVPPPPTPPPTPTPCHVFEAPSLHPSTHPRLCSNTLLGRFKIAEDDPSEVHMLSAAPSLPAMPPVHSVFTPLSVPCSSSCMLHSTAFRAILRGFSCQ